MRTFITVSALALALAGCSDDPTPSEVRDKEITDLNTANTDGKADAMAKALQAGDLAEFTLGGKVKGPQGFEVTDAMGNSAGNFADLRAYVACPQGTIVCDPARQAEGTVYTYVFVVYPGGDNKPNKGVGIGNSVSDIERATAFRMTQPAHGFTGNAGYAKPEALAAIGPKADVVVSCDAGKLVWTVSAGDGGNQWEQKEPLTFYWQSTLPPAGPAEAYALDADGTTAMGSGPYPAAKEGVSNACA
ncbi:hypothetical protein A6F68_02131 [Tsuneonella dongtanensis]|uniref:Lipoprotein n=1 Tax=Tsuneonella dongtanensis TaxID=692370 RepID=A0A1B2AEQ8_9SPHN|nr:hypothetical protein [Tsuneonella dongtanensis]ANY20633.1 hypothetical protein A6F68_02131 [Tsuneonella dongtanensis]